MIRGGGGHLERVIRGEGVTYRVVLPMHKCCVGRVVTCSWVIRGSLTEGDRGGGVPLERVIRGVHL